MNFIDIIIGYTGWAIMILCSGYCVGSHIYAALYETTERSRSPQPIIISSVSFFFVVFGFVSSFFSKGFKPGSCESPNKWATVIIVALQCAHQTLCLYDCDRQMNLSGRECSISGWKRLSYYITKFLRLGSPIWLVGVILTFVFELYISHFAWILRCITASMWTLKAANHVDRSSRLIKYELDIWRTQLEAIVGFQRHGDATPPSHTP
ncbi:uncharacterized protein BDZ99DRAFT_497100 [Mytilinidion resinicola]|uniref:Uncharacterized protein n=1 Tax=Mytilinidion resinicola TaxID=574789 RepID=A0A6A6YW73_9PEZI|nr:uncharacterized protein BDZ99DRAFT_497100 [Mytilinidion resinicola]KAF2812769.1 hypothetical protein BDZ99DRAFT_497100 [Mytilinidion resinicola]